MRVIITPTNQAMNPECIHPLGSETDITTDEYNAIYSQSHVDGNTGMSTRTFDIDIISMDPTPVEIKQVEEAEEISRNKTMLDNVSSNEISSFRAILEDLMSDTPDANETSLVAAATAVYTQICMERNRITQGEPDGEATEST